MARNIFAVKLARRGRTIGFLYSNGTTTDITPPTVPGINTSAIATYVEGLNSLGDAAGYSSYTDAAGATQNRAFIFTGGTRTDLAYPGGMTGTRANDINDSKALAGEANYTNGTTQAFVYREGVLTAPGTLFGFASSAAASMNNNGDVAGTFFNSQGTSRLDSRPFLYANGTMRLIPVPAAAKSAIATDINVSGPIVGMFHGQSNITGALPIGGFLHSSRVTIDLNTLPEVVTAGITLTEALSINATGRTLINFNTGSGNRAYVVTPVR